MEAYNFFISGWVNTVLVKPVTGTDKVVVSARVNHSQRARETPLRTWLLPEKNGTVCTAHCNCMVGLCEACSHVGALLFTVETGVRMRKSVTCTEEKSRWIIPGYVKEIPYKPVSEVDFSSAKRRYASLGEQDYQAQQTKKAKVETPSAEVQMNFFESISKCGIKPAILSLVQPFNVTYVPKKNDMLPKPLTDCFNEQWLDASYGKLLEKGEEIFHSLKVSSEEVQAIETCTIRQSSSKTWFEQRAGRLTASNFRAACHTSSEYPSKSLVKMVCYPESHKFYSSATNWGIKNEHKA